MTWWHDRVRRITEVFMNKILKTALIVGVTVISVLVLIPFIAGLVPGWGYRGWGMMGSGMMGGFTGMGLMSLVWIVILGLIIWAVVAGVRSTANSGRTDYASEAALNVLKGRYASGEINKEEYIYKKKILSYMRAVK
jgi:putative membrane protein